MIDGGGIGLADGSAIDITFFEWCIIGVPVVVVLYLFMRDTRAALIAFTAIPLSLLAAIAVLAHFGYTLNTMTLGGFAVALGVEDFRDGRAGDERQEIAAG
mgnify:CR=1 FL=1